MLPKAGFRPLPGIGRSHNIASGIKGGAGGDVQWKGYCFLRPVTGWRPGAEISTSRSRRLRSADPAALRFAKVLSKWWLHHWF
jgi:hypothetical protein